MASMRATWLWYGVILAATCASHGCSQLGALGYILGGDPADPPKMHRLASDDKKEVKVMILATSTGLETRPELVGVDREFSAFLASHLKKGFERNKEKVTVISPQKVEQYKQQHPGWQHADLDLAAIGRHFKADYVIYLEISNVSLLKDKSPQLYQGSIRAAVRLVDVTKEDDLDNNNVDEFSDSYPDEADAIAVDEKSVEQFRRTFYNHAAERLSWYFTEHSRDDNFRWED